MKWQNEIPAGGDVRRRTGFLFLPKTAHSRISNNMNETRWLEKATWMEKYFLNRYGASWEIVNWVDDWKE